MKKTLMILVASLALLALVSCKEEAEPTRPVLVSYDGFEYEFNYVAANMIDGYGLTVYLLKDMGDFCGCFTPGSIDNMNNYIRFEIPTDLLNKTCVVGQDAVNLNGKFQIGLTGFSFGSGDFSDGTRFSIAYWEKEGKITDLQISFDGKISGTALSFSCSGTPEASVFTPSYI